MEFHTFLEHQVESSRLAETLALQSLDRLMMAKHLHTIHLVGREILAHHGITVACHVLAIHIKLVDVRTIIRDLSRHIDSDAWNTSDDILDGAVLLLTKSQDGISDGIALDFEDFRSYFHLSNLLHFLLHLHGLVTLDKLSDFGILSGITQVDESNLVDFLAFWSCDRELALRIGPSKFHGVALGIEQEHRNPRQWIANGIRHLTRIRLAALGKEA